MDDGASRGNPGMSGYGSAFRNRDGNFLLVAGKGLGVKTNYWAECIAIVDSVELALARGWKNLWVESDAAQIPLRYHYTLGAATPQI
ncbi:hypothetical protein IFM89_003261 [Coptis chinensis]|uniref:RNase H type-1 domain-containing protein n=1 Tax=Coptis chinensis TaxID=261450 RepID=A0A835I8V1_9MAGN|nr:hypothetical protein IFM89_003261 [Coptis chinensis]